MGSSSKTTTQKTEGGSTSTTETTPFQQPFYAQMLGQAQNLYTKGLPDYYGGPTVAGYTPAQMESMNLTSNYITDPAQQRMYNVGQQFEDMLSGQVATGEGTPYGDLAAAYTNQALGAAEDVMAGLRSQQVMSGQQGGSTRGDLLNQRVMEEAQQQISNNLASMYGNAYSQAQQQRLGALGQYGSIMNMPLQMSQALYNQVGLPQQRLNQAIMDDAKKRYDYHSMRPWQNLAQFGNFITGNMGGTVGGESAHSSTTTMS